MYFFYFHDVYVALPTTSVCVKKIVVAQIYTQSKKKEGLVTFQSVTSNLRILTD